MTKVMLLAAGRGDRMRPLTDTIPKPLLKVGEYSLIEHHIFRLKQMNLNEIVINHAWLGEQIKTKLGDGSKFGVSIHYSEEPELAPLETAGGIIRALPFLGATAFIVINADIWTNFDFSLLQLDETYRAHLVMVPNPEFHQQGDFFLEQTELHPEYGEKLTFSGIGIYHPDFFKQQPSGPLALAPLLHEAIKHHQISAECYQGIWCDVGTPNRLQVLNQSVK